MTINKTNHPKMKKFNNSELVLRKRLEEKKGLTEYLHISGSNFVDEFTLM